MMSVRRAMLLWWAASAAGAFAAAAPLLPWFDVLRAVPFHSVPSDLRLLFDRLFTGSTRAQTLPAAPLFEATLWQLLLWRIVLLAPMALTMGMVVRGGATSTGGSPTGPRGVLRALTRLPQFAAATLVLQVLAVLGGGLGLGYAASRLLRAEVGALDVFVGVWSLALSVLFLALCLTLLETARLSLFRRSAPFQGSGSLSCILDGVDALRRHGWRLVATVVGFWMVSVGACALLGGATTFVSTLMPTGFGSVLAWTITQAGAGAALALRVGCWRRVGRLLDSERPVALPPD